MFVEINIKIGQKVTYKKKECVIILIPSLNEITLQEVERGVVHTVKPSDINQNPDSSKTDTRPLAAINKKEWNYAKYRYNIIEPLLKYDSIPKKRAIEIADKAGVHYTSIYRWARLYKSTNQISSLARKVNSNGKFRGRISKAVEGIISSKIDTVYLSKNRQSINKLIRSINNECKRLGLNPPHPNTIRNRVNALSEETKIRKRYGHSKARDTFEPIKSHFPGADYPLSVVQIDHTKLDIILVDEYNRNPFIRPYLTLAIDVYSRVIIGFYLSFDPPGEIGTGICIARSILPKKNWLNEFSLDYEWNCWGVMNTIHLDNAKEFRVCGDY